MVVLLEGGNKQKVTRVEYFVGHCENYEYADRRKMMHFKNICESSKQRERDK